MKLAPSPRFIPRAGRHYSPTAAVAETPRTVSWLRVLIATPNRNGASITLHNVMEVYRFIVRYIWRRVNLLRAITWWKWWWCTLAHVYWKNALLGVTYRKVINCLFSPATWAPRQGWPRGWVPDRDSATTERAMCFYTASVKLTTVILTCNVHGSLTGWVLGTD